MAIGANYTTYRFLIQQQVQNQTNPTDRIPERSGTAAGLGGVLAVERPHYRGQQRAAGHPQAGTGRLVASRPVQRRGRHQQSEGGLQLGDLGGPRPDGPWLLGHLVPRSELRRVLADLQRRVERLGTANGPLHQQRLDRHRLRSGYGAASAGFRRGKTVQCWLRVQFAARGDFAQWRREGRGGCAFPDIFQSDRAEAGAGAVDQLGRRVRFRSDELPQGARRPGHLVQRQDQRPPGQFRQSDDEQVRRQGPWIRLSGAERCGLSGGAECHAAAMRELPGHGATRTRPSDQHRPGVCPDIDLLDQ